MKTPIRTFLEEYASNDNVRLHMPGHKGVGTIERLDLTEVEGADSLYEASGIIKESEANASELFGSYTLYSTEGSSLAIRAMLYLAMLTKRGNEAPLILAGRNAHKVFVSAAALLDFDIEWLSGSDTTYLSCLVSAEDVKAKLEAMSRKPFAVYLTSPDYLGNVIDVRAIADVCHKHGVLLLIDNAHGAYLAFTRPSSHPIALGADMCADSAHKTLPCLTGTAYLHVSDTLPDEIKQRAKSALMLFGSTSPSYILLASLDDANAYLNDGYEDKLQRTIERISALRNRLNKLGYDTVGNEPMKLTIMPKSYGYTGYELSDILITNKIIPEFADPDHLVLMPTTSTCDEDFDKLEKVLSSIKKRGTIKTNAPRFNAAERVMSPRQAIMSLTERVGIDDAEGRVLADITVGCPPAVPIAISGEKINKEMIDVFKYYGITDCVVVK